MRADFAYSAEIEDRLEDFAIWYATYEAVPESRLPYFHREVCEPGEGMVSSHYACGAGLGAEGSRISDVLKGYARLVDQPPPLEREGCMPDDLRAGLDLVYPAGASASSAGMRAALTYGFASFSRGCEFALDDSRKEAFDSSQHTRRSCVCVTRQLTEEAVPAV